MSKYKILVYSDTDKSIFVFCDKVNVVFDKIVTERHFTNGVVASFIIPKNKYVHVMTSNYLTDDGSCPAYFPDGDPDCLTSEGFSSGDCHCCEHFNVCPVSMGSW